MSQATIDITWYPQPKQAELLSACGLLDVVTGSGQTKPPVAQTIGYGGAAYGGKTDADLGVALAAALAYPGCKIGYFRRTFPELQGSGGAIMRSQEFYPTICTYSGSTHTWSFPNGSIIQFAHCQNEADVYKYKSQQFDILIIDEATSFTWFIIDYLLTRNRATVDRVTPFCVMTTNPGDIGHSWFLTLFDLNKTYGEHSQAKEVPNPNGAKQQVYFIPAFLEDNQIGVQRDPTYEQRLMQRDPEVARALRYGDWTVFAGQAFSQWRYDRHVREYEALPDNYIRWRAIDYGFTHPMVCYWMAQDVNSGRIYVYRELLLRGQTDRQQARAIKAATLPDERILFTFASPDMWAHKNTQDMITTSADEYAAEGVILTRADNDRLNGKRKIDRLLADLPDGEPGLVVFNNCTELIRVMPNMVRAKLQPEDVEKVDGDDAYDAFRYGLTNLRGETEQRKVQQPVSSLVGLRQL